MPGGGAAVFPEEDTFYRANFLSVRLIEESRSREMERIVSIGTIVGFALLMESVDKVLKLSYHFRRRVQ